MDIILDTNIIVQENFLRSKIFEVLIDYLERTNSKIVLLQIVKEEAVSQYEKAVSTKLIETKKKIGEFSRICFTTIGIDINIEVAKEIDAFINRLKGLIKVELLYEVPYSNDFLPEIVRRMINREKPCNLKGEECRDVIVWLCTKKLLREKKSLAFISNNTSEFASSDKKDLHPDLLAELSQEKLELQYYINIDDFIKKHANKIDYITKEWIEEELSKIEIEAIIAECLLPDSKAFINVIESKSEDKCVSLEFHNIDYELDDFYVYEMTNGDIYLGLVMSAHVTFEAEFDKAGPILQMKDESALLELSVKVINKKIESKSVELTKFTDTSNKN